MRLTRRRLFAAGAALALAPVGGCLGDDGRDAAATGDGEGDGDGWAWDGTLPVGTVRQYHDPSCGCCGEYVAYLEENGVDVDVEAVDDLEAIKDERSVPANARSCHTVEVGDYLVEGHVPLEAIATLLEEEPDVRGIAAPGMPQHSPGMGPPGDEPLAIYAFDDSSVTEFVEV